MKSQLFDKSDLVNRIGDNCELIENLMDMFFKLMPVEIEKLKKMLHRCDADRTRKQAHKMKGTFANLSAYTMRDIALEIETAARDNNIEKGMTLFKKLEGEFQKFCNEIKL